MSERIIIFVLNHGEFGEYMVKSAELIVGKIDDIYAFSLTKEMSIEDLIQQVESKINQLEGTVVLLTDMFGGTPNNVAVYLQQKYHCHVISGMNLPMLLELVIAKNNSDKDIETLIHDAIQAGQQAIIRQELVELVEDY